MEATHPWSQTPRRVATTSTGCGRSPLDLLILYHVTISFQPWAALIFFPGNEETLAGLWIPMALVNVWRIPILFLISGMGVRFAMERRTWPALLKDRTLRILLPFVFGYFFVTPVGNFFAIRFFYGTNRYYPSNAHLWFLANIFIYFLLLLPLFYWFKRHPDNRFLRVVNHAWRRPGGLFLAVLPFLAEAWLVNPQQYAAYSETLHGYLLGSVCFFMGFVFIATGDAFWPAVARVRWPALGVAFALFLVRLAGYELEGPAWMVAVESTCWMLGLLGLGAHSLNRPSALLRYLSAAVYPVYIVHLPVQFALAYYLLPLPLPALPKYVLLLGGTFGVSFLLYELVLRRLRWLRPLFGMKLKTGG